MLQYAFRVTWSAGKEVSGVNMFSKRDSPCIREMLTTHTTDYRHQFSPCRNISARHVGPNILHVFFDLYITSDAFRRKFGQLFRSSVSHISGGSCIEENQ
jgi:hypothetical protein